jgi:hypothetical protein
MSLAKPSLDHLRIGTVGTHVAKEGQRIRDIGRVNHNGRLLWRSTDKLTVTHNGESSLDLIETIQNFYFETHDNSLGDRAGRNGSAMSATSERTVAEIITIKLHDNKMVSMLPCDKAKRSPILSKGNLD